MAGGVGRSLKKKTNNIKAQRLNNRVSNSVMATPSLSPYKWLSKLGSVLLVLSVLVLLGVSSNTWSALSYSSLRSQSLQIFTADVVHEFPHDPKAFTQGLLYSGNDTLYESIGLYGESAIRRVALQTGKVEIQHKQDHSVFGEGLTLLGERLYQVTWLKKTGFIFDRKNLRELATFTHQMDDGWGLATDGHILFGTDGSSTLYQIDPKTMKVIRKQTVRYEGVEVQNLNELEFVNGEIWANVWQTDCIVRLSPGGNVLGWILLPQLRGGLLQGGHKNIDVLNGIAWDSEKQRIFVTGKLWPKLYEIKLHPLKEQSNVDIQQLCIREHFRF